MVFFFCFKVKNSFPEITFLTWWSPRKNEGMSQWISKKDCVCILDAVFFVGDGLRFLISRWNVTKILINFWQTDYCRVGRIMKVLLTVPHVCLAQWFVLLPSQGSNQHSWSWRGDGQWQSLFDFSSMCPLLFGSFVRFGYQHWKSLRPESK